MVTLDQVFQRESAWIAACGDVDALMDKIQDLGDSIRAAERDGNMLVRMRAGDLLELARKRVVRLSANVIREEAARAARAKPVAAKVVEQRVEPRAVETARAPEPTRTRAAADPGLAQRKAHEEAEIAAAQKAKADARIAAAEADKIELQNKLLRAQVEAAHWVTAAPIAAEPKKAPAPVKAMGVRAPTAARAAPATAVSAAANPASKPATATATAARQPAMSRARPPQSKPAAVPLNDKDGYAEADRLALASVGHWPPTPRDHRGAFWSRHDDWPRDWTLTGADLGRFRGEVNLTRAVFAAQL
ncbi:MAG: hypothetical protein Q7U06_00475, partial [Pseudomonadota bacterium]|nr:hypothetical protein [Pseudomonadota bacterium]